MVIKITKKENELELLTKFLPAYLRLGWELNEKGFAINYVGLDVKSNSKMKIVYYVSTDNVLRGESDIVNNHFLKGEYNFKITNLKYGLGTSEGVQNVDFNTKNTFIDFFNKYFGLKESAIEHFNNQHGSYRVSNVLEMTLRGRLSYKNSSSNPKCYESSLWVNVAQTITLVSDRIIKSSDFNLTSLIEHYADSRRFEVDGHEFY